MKGREALVRQLNVDGFKYMFGNPGTVEQGFLGEIRNLREKDPSSLEYVLALQESVAVAIADGYARAARSPAVIQLHSGVGLGNGIGMLYQARRGGSPLVVLAGDAGVMYDAMDAQMAADLVAMARPVTKYAIRVTHSGSLLRLLRRAIKIAITPPTGPVLVQLPMDILDEECTEEVIRSTTVETRVLPADDLLNRAVTTLLSATNPLIICGDGVCASGASEALGELALILGAPVYGANSSEVNLSFDHPLWGGMTGHMFGEDSRQRMRGADVVFICGTYVFPEVFPCLQDAFDKGTRLIHVDLDAYEIGKNFPVEIGLVADPKLTLEALCQRLRERMDATNRQMFHERVERIRQAIAVERNAHAAEDNRNRAKSEATIAEWATVLRKELNQRGKLESTVIFDEALTESSVLTRSFVPCSPGSYFQTRGGSLGVGIPGAIGIKMCFPEKNVVGFTGDGGSMYTIQALWTAVRYRVDAKFVVISNGGYKLLKRNIQSYWEERQMTPTPFPDSFDMSPPVLRFDEIARSYGVPARRVETTSEIPMAVREMLNAEGPYLVDLVVSSSV